MFTIDFPEWDKELFVFLNNKNIPWLDSIMLTFSSMWVWLIVFVVILLFIIFKNRIHGKAAAGFLIAGVACNLIINNLIKLMIMRPRPGHTEILEGFFNQLEEISRGYSFFSAHSSVSMCVAMFTSLYFKNKAYGIIIFLWAFGVAYSRIYVGNHFPLDVIIGILFGLMIGWITYRFYSQFAGKKRHLRPLKNR